MVRDDSRLPDATLPDPDDVSSGNPITRFLAALGPGLITGASDDDPSGIVTYAIAGAQFGRAMLWTPLYMLPLMVAIQYVSARLAMVGGRGINSAMREVFGKAWLVYPIALLVFVANTINVGADIAAIGASVNLVIPIPGSWLDMPLALAILALIVFGSYRLISIIFRFLALALLAYVASALLAHPDPMMALEGIVVPHFTFSTSFITVLVAVLGTTISPYLWYWQASEEIEHEEARGNKRAHKKGASPRRLRYAAWDTIAGGIASNAVAYFIILAAAVTLHHAGKTHIETARQAAQALQPLAGSAASLLFTVGVVGAGFLAIPVLAGSAAYAVGGAFDWRVGISKNPTNARKFYLVLAASMILGGLIPYSGISAVSLLFYTAVIYGFLAPIIMAVIMYITNDSRFMGEQVNGRVTNVVGWTATGVMAVAAIALIVTL